MWGLGSACVDCSTTARAAPGFRAALARACLLLNRKRPPMAATTCPARRTVEARSPPAVWVALPFGGDAAAVTKVSSLQADNSCHLARYDHVAEVSHAHTVVETYL